VTGGSADLADSLHGAVSPGWVSVVVFRSGAHPAVGGDGDVPCSAYLAPAAPAACQETAVRMVAGNVGTDLEGLEVPVGREGPARHAGHGQRVPIGHTAVRALARVVVRVDERGERAERLLRRAE
jgi:hypothetical protein